MKVFTLKIRSEKIPNPIRVIEPKRAMISTLNFIRLFLIYIQRATYQVGKQETYASILADVLFALYDVWKWRRTFKYDKRWGCELFKTNETTTICVAAHEFVEEHFMFVVAPIRPVRLTIGPINLSHAPVVGWWKCLSDTNTRLKCNDQTKTDKLYNMFPTKQEENEPHAIVYIFNVCRSGWKLRPFILCVCVWGVSRYDCG